MVSRSRYAWCEAVQLCMWLLDMKEADRSKEVESSLNLSSSQFDHHRQSLEILVFVTYLMECTITGMPGTEHACPSGKIARSCGSQSRGGEV